MELTAKQIKELEKDINEGNTLKYKCPTCGQPYVAGDLGLYCCNQDCADYDVDEVIYEKPSPKRKKAKHGSKKSSPVLRGLRR